MTRIGFDITLSDELETDGELRMDVYSPSDPNAEEPIYIWLDRTEAIQIVEHLKKMFSL